MFEPADTHREPCSIVHASAMKISSQKQTVVTELIQR